jgi:hypothetical protein
MRLIIGRVVEAAWIRARAEGPFGRWHMPAGDTTHRVLTACDHLFSADNDLESRPVHTIPANERCPTCQRVHVARSAT